MKDSRHLAAFNKKLPTYLRFCKSTRTSFNPHLTIAYEDLSIEGLEQLEETIRDRPELEKLHLKWLCDHAGLYVKEGKQWRAYHTFRL